MRNIRMIFNDNNQICIKPDKYLSKLDFHLTFYKHYVQIKYKICVVPY